MVGSQDPWATSHDCGGPHDGGMVRGLSSRYPFTRLYLLGLTFADRADDLPLDLTGEPP
jgi:hypothetical protein